MTQLPSKFDILDWLSEHPEANTKREIARAFGIRGAARVELKSLLRELEKEGHLAKRKRSYGDPNRLPPVSVLEVMPPNTDGDLFAKPLEWHGDGDEPRILINLRRTDPALGPGDRILGKLTPTPGEDVHYTARLIRKIGSSPRRVLGVFRKGSEGGRIVPVAKGQTDHWHVPSDATHGAQDGELVEAETLSSRSSTRSGRVRIVTRLGNALAPKSISLIAIHEHGLRDHFPDAVLQDAERAKPAGIKGREDLRNLPLVTIDPENARDHDDAIYAEADNDPGNPGGFKLYVAIADVAHYVTPGSALDNEAQLRGNSAYFPDRVVPMLPERLSADLCSLQPGVPRPCLAMLIRITAEGRKLDHRIMRGLMQSAASLTYEQAQAIEDDAANDIPMRQQIIAPLFAAYRALMIARQKRQPLELDLPERDIRLSDAGKVEAIGFRQRLDAHRLVEECMILANVCAAETLAGRRAVSLVRAHEEPNRDKLEGLREVAEGAGLALPKGVAHTADLNRLLNQAAGSPSAELVNMSVLRAMSQAYYTAQPIGHFGLGLTKYTHFTSPIRRYCDLVVHRALIALLGLGQDGQIWDDVEVIEALGQQISQTERTAMAAERDTVDRYLAAYMAERVGEVMAGRISGVARFGAFVRLEESGGEGLIPIRSLGGEFFHHDPERNTLLGADSGRRIGLGDKVEVRIAEASPVTGGVEMELVSLEGKTQRQLETTRRFRPRSFAKPRGKPTRKFKGKRR